MPEMDDNGRPTVALVAEMVRGLRELTRAEFTNMQRQLDTLTALPVEVSRIRSEQESLSKRIDELEECVSRDEERGYQRRLSLPTLLLSTFIVLIGIGSLLVQIIK